MSTQPIARRPQPSDFRPLQDLTIGEMLEDPRVAKALNDAVPKHFSSQRLLRLMTQAIRKTPKLAQCNPLSLLGALITCASLGLEPNGVLGHAYLIPFEKRKKVGADWVTDRIDVNLIIGYQGLIDLSRRTGSLVSIHADVVHEGDEFEFHYGTDMRLFHRPTGDSEGRKPIFAYAYARLEDGEAFEVLPYASVLKIRDSAQAFKQAMVQKGRNERGWETAPWIAYEFEMARKTMVRRLSKWLPRSIEFASAVQLDSLAERGMIDFGAIAAQPSLAHDPEGASIEAPTDAEIIATTKPGAKAEAPQPSQPEPKPKKVERPAVKAEMKVEVPPATEAEEREADRMTRAANGDTGFGEDDDYDDYLNKMQVEFYGAKTDKAMEDVTNTFRDTVMGAIDRQEITEARGNELLKLWKERAAKKKK